MVKSELCKNKGVWDVFNESRNVERAVGAEWMAP